LTPVCRAGQAAHTGAGASPPTWYSRTAEPGPARAASAPGRPRSTNADRTAARSRILVQRPCSKDSWRLSRRLTGFGCRTGPGIRGRWPAILRRAPRQGGRLPARRRDCGLGRATDRRQGLVVRAERALPTRRTDGRVEGSSARVLVCCVRGRGDAIRMAKTSDYGPPRSIVDARTGRGCGRARGGAVESGNLSVKSALLGALLGPRRGYKQSGLGASGPGRPDAFTMVKKVLIATERAFQTGDRRVRGPGRRREARRNADGGGCCLGRGDTTGDERGGAGPESSGRRSDGRRPSHTQVAAAPRRCPADESRRMQHR